MAAKTTRKKKTKETVKQELLSSLRENNDLEQPGLNVTVDVIIDPLEVIYCYKNFSTAARLFALRLLFLVNHTM